MSLDPAHSAWTYSVHQLHLLAAVHCAARELLREPTEAKWAALRVAVEAVDEKDTSA